jgi:hypothetical protein
MAQFKFGTYPVWSVPNSSAVTCSTQSMSRLVRFLSRNEHVNREERHSSTHSQPCSTRCKFMVSSTHTGHLTVKEELLIPTKQKAMWAPESAWMLWKRRKICCFCWELKAESSSPQTNRNNDWAASYLSRHIIHSYQCLSSKLKW